MTTNMRNGFKACGLYPFNPDAVDYTKCVQNILENLSYQTEKIDDEKITVADIQSAQKVILKIRSELSEKGICADSILTSIHSLLPQESDVNEVKHFSSEDLDNMEVVFVDESVESNAVHVKPTIIILQDILLNSDEGNQECKKSMATKEKLNREQTDEEIQDVENPILVKQIILEKEKSSEVQEAEKSMLNEERQNIDREVEQNIEKPILDERRVGGGEINQKGTVELILDEDKPNNENGTQIQESCENPDELIKGEITDRSFQKHLTYPQPLAKNSKKRQREKIPSAISSNAWRKYYEDKLREKEEKENARKIRKLVAVKKKSNKNTKPRGVMNKITDNYENAEGTHVNDNLENNEKQMEIENYIERSQNICNVKEKCGICEEELESDTEIESEKNVGCDFCPRWYHLGCTKLIGLSYNEVSKMNFTCDFCDYDDYSYLNI